MAIPSNVNCTEFRYSLPCLLGILTISISHDSTVYQGEYKCYGPGADTSKRVQWSHRLSDDETAPFLTKDMIGGKGWLRPAPTNLKGASVPLPLWLMKIIRLY